MLISLHIENIAVIKSVDIDFSEGFSALTGETGAGKSVILDSINLLLGKKADRELIRHGEDRAFVSGMFSCFSENSVKLFSENGVYPDEEGNIFIQRTVFSDGRSQIRINGRQVSLSVLKEISPAIITIHGQSDTNALVEDRNHIVILDKAASLDELLEIYYPLYAEYEKIRGEIKEISEKESERARLIEVLEYQLNDIDALNLHEGEEEELVDKKVKIKNSEKIIKQAGFVFKALKGSEKGSVSYLLDRCVTALSSLSDVIPDFEGYSERLRDFLYQADDIAEEVYAVVEDVDSDPTEKLNEIESRLDKISKLKRKYGLTVSDILNFRRDAAEELEKLKNADSLLEELNKKLEGAYFEASEIADKIHETRISYAKKLEEEVKETLEFLDMPKVVFFTSIKVNTDGERKALSKNGYDSVVFYISANRGIEAQPLSKIASGGELARIMLALKCVISREEGAETVVFDEIDAGVSGKTARKIGVKLLQLSHAEQIICVTHSAQIASLADSHFLIKKSDVNNKTEASVKVLDECGRIEELSRILGGINVTDSQRGAAVDMLKEREIYKNNR